tara:strand:- start:1033 stop:1377 length:345 start_codon:yes stop_codon:yes gene_type:complete
MAEVFKNKVAALGTTSDDGVSNGIYTTPGSKVAVVIQCQVANIDGTNAADLSMDLHDTSASSAKAIVSTLSVPADSAVNPIGGKLVLETGDTLRAWAGAASDLEMTLSVLEIDV